jgi:two-component system sensor histidine kinase UhpB
MSLRYQINLRILLTLLIVLVLGGGAIIFQARLAVAKEVQSSVQLALQLIKLSLNKTDNTTWLHDIASLKETRHLKIHLQQPTGQLVPLGGNPQPLHNTPTPRWFIWLVDTPYPTVAYPLQTFDRKTVQIQISANALDEISEAWQETQVFFSVILWLSGGLLLAVNVIFRQVLHTVEQILQRLSDIENEDYHTPLPISPLHEFARIAQAINHLTTTLQKEKQENQRLTLHSLEIAEAQRQTLAQELHDELGQSLTAIKVMAVTGKKNPATAPESCQRIIDVCDHLFKVVRSMMKNLHPLILTELGFSASLHDLISHWQQRTPLLKIHLDCTHQVDEIPAKIAIQLFRMIQEAITNTVRHAHAQHLDISLHVTPVPCPTLHLHVQDDGIGCDLAHVSLGFGLLGIKARVKSLTGTFALKTEKNQGLTLSITLPLPSPENDCH